MRIRPASLTKVTALALAASALALAPATASAQSAAPSVAQPRAFEDPPAAAPAAWSPPAPERAASPPPRRGRYRLVVGGAVLAALAYLPMVVHGISVLSSPSPEVGVALLIPGTGPLIAAPLVAGNHHGPIEAGLYIADGLAQLAGITLIVAGALAPSPARAAPRWALTPGAPGAQGGATVTAVF